MGLAAGHSVHGDPAGPVAPVRRCWRRTSLWTWASAYQAVGGERASQLRAPAAFGNLVFYAAAMTNFTMTGGVPFTAERR
ncbi:hypothetical protein Acor_29020 [Acrocarpospora corrugata]|uniref:Uncharacterized protein n=1 Tax=Acrocarpospora corrugata TaxID=35763 RepID=A0A5M3W2L4_9ACTN|nr:hypothetical protein Acor_29020 [Acrocarpospora corrugata]